MKNVSTENMLQHISLIATLCGKNVRQNIVHVKGERAK